RLPGAGERGPAAVVGSGLGLGRRAGGHAAPLPAADQREPLGAHALQRPGLEPGGPRLLRSARARRGPGARRPALVTGTPTGAPRRSRRTPMRTNFVLSA